MIIDWLISLCDRYLDKQAALAKEEFLCDLRVSLRRFALPSYRVAQRSGITIPIAERVEEETSLVDNVA